MVSKVPKGEPKSWRKIPIEKEWQHNCDGHRNYDWSGITKTTCFIFYIDYIDIKTNKLFSYVARTTNMYFRTGKFS